MVVTVASLLNPLPQAFETNHSSPGSATVKYSREPSTPPPAAKKLKMSKVTAKLAKGKTRGEVKYRPFENPDERTAEEYERFKVTPIGRIADFPKTIPYNSEKKTFQQRTGRDRLEVYQYTFTTPNDDSQHTVMWDYNVGLVRVTAFFKSLKHNKTMPAKVMNANPGLREISHSITGGSILAQGYWVPYDAAKAVAARFCYEIRYPLVPVFGPDFVSMCYKPGDLTFLRLNIEPSVILRCAETANAVHTESRESSLAVSPRTQASASPRLPWPPKSLRPKQFKKTDIESGYGTDTDRSEQYPSSPASFGPINWTPVNTPEPAYLALPPRHDVTSTPRDATVQVSVRDKNKSSMKRSTLEIDDDFDTGSLSTRSSAYSPAPPKRRKIQIALTPEAEAAFTLLQLHRADDALGKEKSLRGRRATA